MPALAFEDFVQRGARADRGRHSAKHPGMRFFFERALPQEFLHILFTSQSTLGLITKFRFVPFFRGFHPANSDLGAGNLVPPTI